MTSASARPDPGRLEAAIKALSHAGQRRLVIAAVETWASRDRPSPSALLHQIRALIDLGMTDHALTRMDALPHHPWLREEVLVLRTRALLDQAGPARAREPLEALRQRAPDHPDIPRLERAFVHHEDLANPEISGVAMSHRDALRLVRKELAAGRMFRARALLDTFENNWPGDPSFGDLRWALAGDYRLEQTSLFELAQRWGGPQPADEDQPTDSIPVPTDALSSAPLPALFGSRRPRPGVPSPSSNSTPDDPEATAGMRLDDVFGPPEEPPSEAGSDDEPTQLLRVMRHAGSPVQQTPHEAPASDAAEIADEDEDLVVLHSPGSDGPPVETRMPRAATHMPERLPLPPTQPLSDPAIDPLDTPLASDSLDRNDLADGISTGHLAFGLATGALLVLGASAVLALMAASA